MVEAACFTQGKQGQCGRNGVSKGEVVGMRAEGNGGHTSAKALWVGLTELANKNMDSSYI